MDCLSGTRRFDDTGGRRDSAGGEWTGRGGETDSAGWGTGDMGGDVSDTKKEGDGLGERETLRLRTVINSLLSLPGKTVLLLSITMIVNQKTFLGDLSMSKMCLLGYMIPCRTGPQKRQPHLPDTSISSHDRYVPRFFQVDTPISQCPLLGQLDTGRYFLEALLKSKKSLSCLLPEEDHGLH